MLLKLRLFIFLRVHIAAADTGDGAARRCKQFLDFICFFLIHEPVSPNLKSNLKFHLIVDQISREVKSPASGVNARQTKRAGTAVTDNTVQPIFHYTMYILFRLSPQQYLHCLPESRILSHITRKYHIWNMRKPALLPRLPDRHAGTYLPITVARFTRSAFVPTSDEVMPPFATTKAGTTSGSPPGTALPPISSQNA